MSSLDSNMKMMRKALERSYAFSRGLCRFSFRDTIKHPSKITRKKFKNKKNQHIDHEKNRWQTIRYWLIIISIPFLMIVINFSFISDPTKFFSKFGGINVGDMKKFIILPIIAIIAFFIWAIYSYIKSPNKNYLRRKTKIKHIKVKHTVEKDPEAIK